MKNQLLFEYELRKKMFLVGFKIMYDKRNQFYKK